MISDPLRLAGEHDPVDLPLARLDGLEKAGLDLDVEAILLQQGGGRGHDEFGT